MGNLGKRSFVVIGGGPAGFYAADALLRKIPGCRIDILDRIPAPFGLVRHGVAPDHEKTKNVTRAYDRVFTKGDARYFGNVEVGRDIELAALREAYDAVIIATGCPLDRGLDIPGIGLDGVYGSAEIVGWYNSHPDFRDLAPRLDSPAVAVIGNGNVALDLARLLVRPRAQLAATDIAPFALEAIDRAPITDVYIFGRRGPIEASFTKSELSEMGDLADCHALVRRQQLPAAMPPPEDTGLEPRVHNMKRANLELLRGFAANRPGAMPRQVHFEFLASPVEVLGGTRVEGLKLERTRLEAGRAVGSGETFTVEVGAVFTAIGYRGQPLAGAPFDDRRAIIANRDGHVEGNLYVVGWAKRGPTGTIPTNRGDSFAVVDLIAAALTDRSQTGSSPANGAKPGRQALEAHLAAVGRRAVSFDDWKKLRALEEQAGAPKAPRRKFATIADMLSALD